MRGKAEHFDKREEPKLEEQGHEKIKLGYEKIKDTYISGFENVLETKPPEYLEPAISESPRHELEKASFPSLRSDDFEEPGETKPTLKSRIKGIIEKMRVSKTDGFSHKPHQVKVTGPLGIFL